MSGIIRVGKVCLLLSSVILWDLVNSGCSLMFFILCFISFWFSKISTVLYSQQNILLCLKIYKYFLFKWVQCWFLLHETKILTLMFKKLLWSKMFCVPALWLRTRGIVCMSVTQVNLWVSETSSFDYFYVYPSLLRLKLRCTSISWLVVKAADTLFPQKYLTCAT
jgi:hypothetical protein